MYTYNFMYICILPYIYVYVYFCMCIYFISTHIFIRSLFIQYTCTCDIDVFYLGRTYRDVHQFMCTIILLTNDPIMYFILFLFLSLSPLLASFFLSLSQIVSRTLLGSQKPQGSPFPTFFRNLSFLFLDISAIVICVTVT